MDKIKIANLGFIPEPQPVIISIGDAHVQVTPVIPYEKMLEMLQWCINIVLDERPFLSEPIRQIIVDFALLRYYTNIEIPIDAENFDLNQMYENYDLLLAHDVIEKVTEVISEKQLTMFRTHLEKTCDSILAYRNSAAGILDKLSAMAQGNTNALEEALSTFNDPTKLQQVEHLMEIVDKLGVAPNEESGGTPAE